MPDSPRWATADDDHALRELCRRTPMRGAVSYTLEREPEFFALLRMQGYGSARVAVITADRSIVAMLMMAPMVVWHHGRARRTAYLGDLKVDPAHRNEGLAGQLLRFIQEALRHEQIDLSSFLVLSGNPMLKQMSRGELHFESSKLASIRNHFLLFGWRRMSAGDSAVSHAIGEAVQEMIALWNRLNAKRDYAPVLDEKLFARWTDAPFSLDDFRLFRRDGRVVAFCSVWDAAGVKQIRMGQLSTSLRIGTAVYNGIARLTGRARFPKKGRLLRFLYIAHACAERPEDLALLLAQVHDEFRNGEHLYMDLALDRADPLVSALRRFRSMKIDFELWETRTAGVPSTIPDAGVAAGCAYLDVSLV